MTARTKRYIRTRFGTHDFKSVAKHFWAVAQGTATQEDVNVLFAVLQVAFGEAGSLPPGPGRPQSENDPEVTIEWD